MAAQGAESPGSQRRGDDRGGVTMAGRGGAVVNEVAWRGEAATEAATSVMRVRECGGTQLCVNETFFVECQITGTRQIFF
jgi:hypothetical protein